MPRPHFTPGKDPVPIVQEAGWAPGPVWMYLPSNSMEQRPSLEANTTSYGPEIQRIYMEHEGSLPHSQEPATCPYPEMYVELSWNLMAHGDAR